MSLKPLSSKTRIFLYPSSSSSPSPYSILICHLCSSPRSHSSRRHHEEESRNIKVSVWWDFENCSLPARINVFKVAHTITAAIRANGIKGPIQITAFGDVLQLSRAKQEALSSTGINLAHVPHGGKNSADRSLFVDLMYWVSQNPPPAHLFLISGDRDFASLLHRLRMNNYNILLASTDTAPSVLCSAASIMWRWNDLVKGETQTGKIFNQPPDGPYGSWYGHYKVPLEDPFSVEHFSVVEQQTCSQNEELTEASLEPKVRSIPKAVVKQIRDILSSYPKGISISEFRSELGKSNVGIEKDFYGYKKFSRFLLSMPNILKLQSTGDGQFVVRGIIAKPEAFEPSPYLSTGSVASDGNKHLTRSINTNGEDQPTSGSEDQKSVLPTPPEPSIEGPTRKVQQSPPFVKKAVKMNIEQPPQEIKETPSNGELIVEAANATVAQNNLPHVMEQDPKSKMVILKKIWRRWFGSNDESSGLKVCDNPKKSQTSGDNFDKKGESTLKKCDTLSHSLEKKEVNKKILKLTNQENVPVSPTSWSSFSSQSTLGNDAILSSEPFRDNSGKHSGLLSWVAKWFKVGAYFPDSNSPTDQPSEEIEQKDRCVGKRTSFSQDSFWRDIESFFNSPAGSLLVLQSRTREQMANKLQKNGPLVLRSLNPSDAVHLVDFLISEKKWVEEYPSEASPFKLSLSVEKNASSNDSHPSNGLRSIFLGTTLQSDLKRQSECDANGRNGRIQNISHAGVSQPVSYKKPSERSRSETLRDCQKLVNEILKDFPDGYNIGSFRKLFLERYGYHLDFPKLGYQKLSSLLQILPGVKVESTYIIPSSKVPKSPIGDSDVPNVKESDHISANFGSESSDALKDDESDSTWEELGPIDNTHSSQNELEEKFASPHYELSLSDDDSDSGESLAVTQPEGQSKSGVNCEDSSLLQILDSWYSSQDRKDKSESVQGMVDCSKNGLQSSDPSRLSTKINTSSGNYGHKQRPQKSYSFVADSEGNNPDTDNPNKLIDDMIGSLKKSGGLKVRS